MKDTQEKIAAGLEQAFASAGFAEPGVDQLRDATQVSLRTLYKYCPSREDMVLTALEHRHGRYLAHLFEGLPLEPQAALMEIFERVGDWMRSNAAQGCLFHSAVAAQPHNAALRQLLERHKAEVAGRLGQATGLEDRKDELMLLHEGLTQSWTFMGAAAVERAKALAVPLLKQVRAHSVSE
ncbi:TetR/AcrR family transcriptional regulator [Fodinicurvata halophila]|uniref:TetR/AcrR family transcriptional regulator n=1 Tax=Fodinicurvata halophila TaxID=1419723 RepID=A0ABV8UGI2_9PROT